MYDHGILKIFSLFVTNVNYLNILTSFLLSANTQNTNKFSAKILCNAMLMPFKNIVNPMSVLYSQIYSCKFWLSGLLPYYDVLYVYIPSYLLQEYGLAIDQLVLSSSSFFFFTY